MTEKKCTKCGQTKKLDGFYKKKNGLCGRHAECKTCLLMRDRAVRAKRSEAAKKFKNKKDWIRKKVLSELANDLFE